MAAFLVFNWFRLVVGATFDWSCDHNVQEVVTAALDPSNGSVIFSNDQVVAMHWQAGKTKIENFYSTVENSGSDVFQVAIPANETNLDYFWEVRTDKEANITTYLGLLCKSRNNFREAPGPGY